MDDRLLVLRMTAWMEEHLTNDNPGQELSRVSGYSENRLRQKFFNVTGETPSGYLRKRRLTEAAKALMAHEHIIDVAATYGYSSQDNFTTAFKAWFGINPGELQTMDKKYRTLVRQMKEPLNIMELDKLKQSPLCATLMGCVKGASDYFDLDWTVPKLFGYSTHAFVVNLHKDFCPSSPYVWNKDQFFLRLRDMGIRKVDSISLNRESTKNEFETAERRIREHLDTGKLVIMDFLEHQLISGYDTKSFISLQPWNGESGMELASLSFGGMKEAMDKNNWIWFSLIEKEEFRADEASLLRSSLTTAIRMRTAPSEFECEGYRVGDGAWENWIAGVQRGLGSSHGNWWSGMVWMECRNMAADFFAEIGPGMKSATSANLCGELAKAYRECAKGLDIAKEKSARAEDQKKALASCRESDAKCESLMRQLLSETL